MAAAWDMMMLCAAAYGSLCELPLLQLPNGGEQWLGGYTPSMYSNLVNRLGSLNVVQNLTRSPNAPKQTSA
jgi:hypothetical protein